MGEEDMHEPEGILPSEVPGEGVACRRKPFWLLSGILNDTGVYFSVIQGGRIAFVIFKSTRLI
jgi:hypothetical protein